MMKKQIQLGIIILFVMLLATSFVSAYARSVTGFTQFPSFSPTGGAFQGFDRSMCEAGQDFILQVAPLGCTPSVVRSDLLEDQNVPVYCPITATQLNPLIDVRAINHMTFSGKIPPEVLGRPIYHPARAALGRLRSQIDSPILDNVGYVVIVLKRQKNASAMPDFVEGKLNVTMKYDIENAFGVGQASYYLPQLTDAEWENRFVQYGFWNGRGYLRAEAIDNEGATIAIYSDRESFGLGKIGEKRRVSSANLKIGETSRKIFIPGFNSCLGSLQLRLNGLESPGTRARLLINADVVEVKRGEKFLENRCQIRSVEKQGIVQKVRITCEEDRKRNTFDLFISPKIELNIDNQVREVNIGDRLYQRDDGKSVYLVYINTKGNSLNEKDLSIVIAAIPENKDKLSEGQLSSIAGFLNRLPSSEIDNFLDLGLNVLKVYTSGAEIFLRNIMEGQAFRSLPFGETKEIFGKNINIGGFAGARDADISGFSKDFRNYYDGAIEDYEAIIDSFSTEKYPEDTDITLGEQALFRKINLAKDAGQKKIIVGLCNEFKERYPDSAGHGICDNAYQLSSQVSSVRDVSINGRTSSISFEGISEPTFEEFGAKIVVRYPNGDTRSFDLRNNDIIYLNESTGESIQLVDLDKDPDRINQGSAKIKVKLKKRTVEIVKQFILESSTKNLKLGFSDDFGSNYLFTLQEVNLKKSAKVSVIPSINYASTKADFKFKIGIEKRGIKLSPEKTREKISSLNETLKKWGDRSDKLGKVVKTFKTACLGVGTALTVKNFFANLGGKGIARQKIMRGDGGWIETCESLVPEQYRSVDSCLLDNSKEIDSAVDEYSDAIEAQSKEFDKLQEGITENTFLLEKVVDTEKFMKRYLDKNYKNELSSNLEEGFGKDAIKVGSDNIKISKIIEAIDENTTLLTQARNLQLNSRLLDSDNERVREIALNQITKDLGDIYVSSRVEVERQSLEDKYGIPAIIGSTKDLREFTITDVKTFGEVKSGFSGGKENISDGSFVYIFQDRSDAQEYLLVLNNDYVITQTYEINNGVLTVKKEGELNPLELAFTRYDRTSYKNQYKNPEVRYYERDPYKGFPAIVPFDLKNGWYAAVKSNLPIGGTIRSYDESGRVSSFYLCNVGRNGREEFNSGIGDDICRGFVPRASQPPDFPGLDKGEASRLVRRVIGDGLSIGAIEQAQQQYRSGVSQVRIYRQTIKVGTPYANIPDIQCQDFMSPSDCNLLFNVCDPVICPSSRCDLDGTYPVRDVVQSGIIGSLALCLPNFPEVKVPICLSGVNAGLEAWISVLDSHQQCLQTSLDTGQTVGICEELNSIYMCDFFWRQSLPLARVAIPKVLGTVLGQNVRGGGEYLGVADAWSNAQQSVDYFAQYYAANSFKAFKARSAEGVGGEVCKNFISVINPQGGNLLDALTDPDSPPQFYGRFDEIPFTTATNPPISQYKVFYHIYAGQDSRAYYEVYLRDPSGSSFYQDTAFRRIVAKNFIGVGEYATETKDFIAPSGYKQLCIIVNGQEECGFKQVSTSFAVNYVTEQYISQQASQVDIKSETQCISGSPSAYSLLSPNIQAGVEEVINPAIYNRGIIRVCATDNPGKGTDAFAGGEDSRWKDVGYCDNQKLRCWLDEESVRDVVRSTAIEDQILGEVTDNYVEKLKAEGDYIDDFKGFVDELKDKDNLETIKIIDTNLLKAFLSNERAYLHLLRGDAYEDLAIKLYQGITGEGRKSKEEKSKEGLDIEKFFEEVGREAEELESAIESGITSPIFEFKDGRATNNLYYVYFGDSWHWSEDKEKWQSVKAAFGKEDILEASQEEGFSEEDQEFTEAPSDVLAYISPFEKLSTKNQQFIISLKGKSYTEGLGLLLERTKDNAEGGFFFDATLSTESVDFSHEDLFTVRQGGATDIYFEYKSSYGVLARSVWSWSLDKENWMFVPETVVKDGQFDGVKPVKENVVLIRNLDGQSYYNGAGILFGIVEEETKIEEIEEIKIEEKCNDYVSCQKITGKKIVEIARQKKLENSLSDESVKKDTGAKSFECLVLQLARTESSLRHCERSHDGDNDPLYCDRNIRELLGGDEGSSQGVMQINKDVHKNVDFASFTANVEFGIDLLIGGYIEGDSGRTYTCYRQVKSSTVRESDFVNKVYTGWERALRGYNGWNSKCTRVNEETKELEAVGNPNYVEDVVRDEVRENIISLFPKECGS